MHNVNGLLVRIKKLHPDAVIPSYAKPGDAGLDFTAISSNISGDIITYQTGLAVEIPEGYVGLLFPRSSIFKKDLELTNSVGVVDSQFRGELLAKFRKTKMLWSDCNIYEPGERIMQLIILPYPTVVFLETSELSETERGTGGFGSSGK